MMINTGYSTLCNIFWLRLHFWNTKLSKAPQLFSAKNIGMCNFVYSVIVLIPAVVVLGRHKLCVRQLDKCNAIRISCIFKKVLKFFKKVTVQEYFHHIKWH